MDISVIIVNYNTGQITKECLDSIFAQTHNITFEVIVVDNASTDNSYQLLSNYPQIKYIESPNNLGFGKANNLGYQYTSGDYILLLNSDTILKNNALFYFVENFKKQSPNIACIGSWLQSTDGSLNNSGGNFPSIKRSLFSTLEFYMRCIGINKQNRIAISNQDEIKEIDYIIGADLCIRRNIIEELGMFDPDFFMYYEETEMQYRYHNAGYKMLIIPGPQIVHLERASTRNKNKKYSYINRKMFLHGQFLYFRKVYNYPLYLLYRLIYLLNFPMFLMPYYTWNEKILLLKHILSSSKSII